MAGYLHNDTYDAALNVIVNATKTLHITSQQVSTFANVATYTLGNKTSPSVGAPANHTTGRKVTVAAITGGSVTATGTATHYAVVDTANSKVLASQALSASQAVTSGNTFSLAAFDIAFPAPIA